MSIAASTIPSFAQGETARIDIDWGENIAGQETGVLKAWDTIVSCTASVDSAPAGATNPTIGTPSVNVLKLIVNGRSCEAGTATTCSFSTGSSQAAGVYRLKFTATTSNSLVIPRFIYVQVVLPK